MQAIIMAAGESTRTHPLTIEKPKPLLKICNKPILKHTLEQLQGIVKEAIIIVGFKSDLIKKEVGQKYGSIKIKYIEQKQAEGTGKAIVLAKDLLKDKFLVVNGDDLFSRKDIKGCLKHDFCILVKEVEDVRNFGQIDIKDNQVMDIKEKPLMEKPGLANTGLYVFTKEIFSYKLKKSARGEYEITDYINFLIKDEKKVFFETVKEYWFPITFPWSLLDANEFFMKSLKGKNKAVVEKGAVLKNPIVIGKNTIIKSGAYIEGPVIIGDNCTIGPNCYIRPCSTIENGCKIGNGVEIKNSIIGKNTCIGHLSYVGDSVIGENVNLGAGTITANLRHDEKNIMSPVKKSMVDTRRRKLGAIIGDSVHTGIHTSIYPGRKIWIDKTTFPGQVVKEDIR